MNRKRPDRLEWVSNQSGAVCGSNLGLCPATPTPPTHTHPNTHMHTDFFFFISGNITVQLDSSAFGFCGLEQFIINPEIKYE